MFTIMYLHPGCQPDLTMMYAGTKQAVVKFAEVTKVCLPNVTHTHTHAHTHTHVLHCHIKF